MRSNSRLLRVRLASAGACRLVVVKTHTGAYFERKPPIPFWPRLTPAPQTEDAAASEYRTLLALHQEFTTRRDPGLTAVRPLDLLPDGRTLVMEYFRGRTLQAGSLRWSRARAEAAFRDAGRWLRRFHGTEGLAPEAAYRPRREDLVRDVHRLTRLLLEHGERDPVLRELADDFGPAVSCALPDDLRLVPGHGDFWPGNVLVGPEGIAALDTHAWWRTPAQEDLAYFLTNFGASTVQVFTVGRFCPSRTALLARAFLGGYFDDQSVDMALIQPYEMLALLIKWGVAAHDRATAHGLRRLAKNAKIIPRRATLRRMLSARMAEIRTRRNEPARVLLV